jgi:uncharacterized protein (TIGR00255 family)
MKSMTGYAYSEHADNEITVSMEIKGYNNRFLDISVFLPPWLSALEAQIREYMGSRFNRGKIETCVRIKEHNGDILVSINKTAAQAYYKAVSELSSDLGIEGKPDIKTILDFEGVLETEKTRDTEKYWSVIQPVLIASADKFEAERNREGLCTRDDILLHIGLLEDSQRIIEKEVPDLETSIRENLRTRFMEVLGNQIDENRILAETAVLLMKYTISEELSRLSSHLAEFRLELDRNPAPGKKLDFLCQEINREVNTIGSKTPVLQVSRAVVEMKNALENIREQLRNVE